MRHLVIGQRQKAPNFWAFHWSPHGCLITIGQDFVTTRVVHLPKRTETSLITESDQSRANHQLLQLCTVHTAWSDSDQAVHTVHSCKSWFKCGVWLFIVLIVRYKIENGQWERAVHLAVAGDVFDGVSFCVVVLSHKMSLMRSGTAVPEHFPTYSCSLPAKTYPSPSFIQTFLL